ncbi:MAG: LuxR C-terminal-related transcriptional regulator, partial [Dehalococcoidia bacterium]
MHHFESVVVQEDDRSPAGFRRTRLLRPRVMPDVVVRTRLIGRLHEGLRRPLTLLASPPGFGKTTLLSSWAAQELMPVAWLSIDEPGDTLASFVAHMIGAVQTVEPGIGRETLGLLSLGTPPAPQTLAAVLADELIDLADDIALVIDDYHLISDPSVHEFVSSLLDHRLPSVHLILATRADPPLPLTRLRMRGQLSEFRAPSLRFTAEETAVFFKQSTDVALDAATVARIEQRAEGWPAGLRLAALTLQEGATPDAVLAAFEGRRLRGLMQFLMEEVLAVQPADLRQFLLRTSIVERICAPLAAVLLDDGTSDGSAESMLDRIARANLFLLPLTEDPSWYRYHSLFRDALRDYLGVTTGPDGVAALHMIASRWFAGRGMVRPAITHARAAGNDEAAARIVEQNIHVALNRDDLPALESWLDLLPPDVQAARPALILGRSWIADQRGSWVLHGRLVDEARVRLEAGAPAMDAATVAALEGELETARSVRLLDAGDGAATAEAARRALALLPNTHRYVLSIANHQQAFAELIAGRVEAAVQYLTSFLDGYDRPPDVVWVRTLLALMRVHARAGNLTEAGQVAAHVHRLAPELGYLTFRSWADYQLGAIAYDLNDLHAARGHFSAVVADPLYAHSTPLRDASFGLALIQRATGQAAEAWRTLDQLKDFFRQMANIEQATLARALQSHFAPAAGSDTLTILNALGPGSRPAGLVGMLGNPIVIRIEALVRHAGAASLAEAETLLNGQLAESRRLHFVRAEIELLALQSVLLQTQGDPDGAAATLGRALALAEREGVVRIFLDRGSLLADVLRPLRSHARHGAFAGRLLAALAAETPKSTGRMEFGGPVAVPAAEVSDTLTDREIEILKKLAARLTYKEIADALVISPFTVKGHVSNIYGKLAVSGRRAALARARSLGLL